MGRAPGFPLLSARALCYALARRQGNCRAKSVLFRLSWLYAPLWGAALVAARAFGRSLFCWLLSCALGGARIASLLRLSRGPPPRFAFGVGPPPLPLIPRSPRLAPSATLRAAVATLPWESGRALAGGRLHAGSHPLPRILPPARMVAAFMLTPLALAPPRGSALLSRSRRVVATLQCAASAPDALVVCAPRARGCPSRRARFVHATASCPRALRLRPPSSRWGLLAPCGRHPLRSSGVSGGASRILPLFASASGLRPCAFAHCYLFFL